MHCRDGDVMKKVFICLISIVISVVLLSSTGCKKTEKPEHPENERLSKGSDDIKFNPDEPAPVPEGTPPY